MSSPVVLITGALTGIGRATALAFANEGARALLFPDGFQASPKAENGEFLDACCAKLGTATPRSFGFFAVLYRALRCDRCLVKLQRDPVCQRPFTAQTRFQIPPGTPIMGSLNFDD